MALVEAVDVVEAGRVAVRAGSAPTMPARPVRPTWSEATGTAIGEPTTVTVLA